MFYLQWNTTALRNISAISMLLFVIIITKQLSGCVVTSGILHQIKQGRLKSYKLYWKLTKYATTPMYSIFLFVCSWIRMVNFHFFSHWYSTYKMTCITISRIQCWFVDDVHNISIIHFKWSLVFIYLVNLINVNWYFIRM